MVRTRVVVHGGVQGVGFRYSARLEADRSGVAGWIRNRSDGTVEAEIEGDEASVQEMIGWLSRGPRGARVTHVETEDVDPLGEHGFRVTG
jgi:acylphosphatase